MIDYDILLLLNTVFSAIKYCEFNNICSMEDLHF